MIMELLRCPKTGAALEWDAEQQLLVNRQHAIAYPKRDGLWLLLPSQARPYSATALLTAKDRAIEAGHALAPHDGAAPPHSADDAPAQGAPRGDETA